MHTSMSVSRLIRLYPYAEDALQWHGLDVRGLPGEMTVAELMQMPDVDSERLLRDLRQVETLYEGEEAWQWAREALPIAANLAFDEDDFDVDHELDSWRWSELADHVA